MQRNVVREPEVPANSEYGGVKDATILAGSIGCLSVTEFLQNNSSEQYAFGGVGAALGVYAIYRAVKYLK